MHDCYAQLLYAISMCDYVFNHVVLYCESSVQQWCGSDFHQYNKLDVTIKLFGNLVNSSHKLVDKNMQKSTSDNILLLAKRRT